MRNAKAWLLTVALATVAAAQARDASACGGCFIAQSESTVVTGHKMILSVSQQQTTLYDQIVYSGDPSSFAWILPVKGVADVGLSSDALFQALDQATTTTINSPQLTCPPPPDCGFDNGGPFAGGGGAGGSSSVTVVAQNTVGPYETVQLNSADPSALGAWLAQHGYNIPSDIQPVIDAYVGEGFDFLALKLVPGQGVSAMRPVRISTPGASAVLPLRMVAAGTGAITPITLWVMAEGRYDAVNLPSFTIDPNELVWDWDTQSSNYTQVKQAAFAATQNKGWLVQAGEPFSKYILSGQLNDVAMYDPQSSGYGDAMGNGAMQEVADDLEALFGTIPDASLWVTRLNGELSRAALGADLQLGAASDQTQVNRYFNLTNSIGTPPPCPEFPPCSEGAGGFGEGGAGGSIGAGWGFWWQEDTGGASATGGGNSGGCATGNGGSAPMLGGLALLAALAFARRRR
jgi:MYXO-CTERM domain-containing protein